MCDDISNDFYLFQKYWHTFCCLSIGAEVQNSIRYINEHVQYFTDVLSEWYM